MRSTTTIYTDVLFIESRYRSMFARAVLFNREIVGSITLGSFIRAKRMEENFWQHKR